MVIDFFLIRYTFTFTFLGGHIPGYIGVVGDFVVQQFWIKKHYYLVLTVLNMGLI